MFLSVAYYLIRSMFKREEMGRDLKEGCLANIAIFSVPIVIGLIIGLGTRDKNVKPAQQAFMSTTSEQGPHPWSGNRLDKENINDVNWDDTVFICTSGSSRRYHSTLSCPGMQNCESGERALTREKAENMGHTHCRRCYYDY